MPDDPPLAERLREAAGNPDNAVLAPLLIEAADSIEQLTGALRPPHVAAEWINHRKAQRASGDRTGGTA